MEKNLGLESIISTTTLTNCFRGECKGKRRQQNPKIPLLHNWLQQFDNWGQQSTHARKTTRRTGVFLRQNKTHESSQVQNLLSIQTAFLLLYQAESWTHGIDNCSPCTLSKKVKRNWWVGRKHTNCTQLVLDKPAANRIHFYNLLLVLRPSKTVRAAATDGAPRYLAGRGQHSEPGLSHLSH